MLWHHVLRSEAYRSLKPIPRAAYTELRRRFNGSNNGEILCSVRNLADAVNCSKDSASAAFAELEAKGFIKCAQRGSFNYKVAHAPKWVLTEEPYHDGLPTKEFMRWRAPEENGGPKSRTSGPGKPTAGDKKYRSRDESVLNNGPRLVENSKIRS